MIILYVLLIAYILAVNFYAFLLVKSLRDKEKEAEETTKTDKLETAPIQANGQLPQRYIGKLCVTGLLGGAITIYVCIMIFKWKRSDMLLMILMPLLGVLNIYFWILLFRSGFRFFMIG